jgi:hypothetical protein
MTRHARFLTRPSRMALTRGDSGRALAHGRATTSELCHNPTDADGELLIMWVCAVRCPLQVTSHLRDKHNVVDDLRRGLIKILIRYPYSFRNPLVLASATTSTSKRGHMLLLGRLDSREGW